MGVEHALTCKRCKEWIDLHKCYETYRLCSLDGPPANNISWPIIEGYWGGRALWFAWKHRDHGSELEWKMDASDDYYEMCGYFKEVGKHVDVKSEKT